MTSTTSVLLPGWRNAATSIGIVLRPGRLEARRAARDVPAVDPDQVPHVRKETQDRAIRAARQDEGFAKGDELRLGLRAGPDHRFLERFAQHIFGRIEQRDNRRGVGFGNTITDVHGEEEATEDEDLHGIVELQIVRWKIKDRRFSPLLRTKRGSVCLSDPQRRSAL